MKKVRNDFSLNNWRKSISSNYYKALDIKSNSTKIIERKKLINKSLIKDFNLFDKNKKINFFRICDTVKKILLK